MKKVLLFMIVFTTILGHGQNDNNNKKKVMKKFNIEKYSNLPYNESVSSARSTNNSHYKKGDELINIMQDEKYITVRTTNELSPYVQIEYYLQANNQLVKEQRLFSNVQYGLWKEYDIEGNLINEVNYDENFNFSIQELINKMKKEFEIDLMNKYLTSVYRTYDRAYGIPFYKIKARSYRGEEGGVIYIVDGNNGSTISKMYVSPGEDDEERIKDILRAYIEK